MSQSDASMISGESTGGGDCAGVGSAAAKGKDTAPQCGLPSCAAKGTKRCTACKAVYYCSQAHQRSHWKDHKVGCRGGKTKKRASVGGGAGGGAMNSHQQDDGGVAGRQGSAPGGKDPNGSAPGDAVAPKGKGAEEGGHDSGEGGEQIYRSELDEENEELRQREDRESRAQTKAVYDEVLPPGIDVSIIGTGDLVGSTSGLTLEQAELLNRELRQACGLRVRTDYRTDPRTAAEKWEEAKWNCHVRSEYNVMVENEFGEELFIYMEGGVVKFMHSDMGIESHTSYAAASLSNFVDPDSLANFVISSHGDSCDLRVLTRGLHEHIWALGDTPLELDVVQAVQAFNDNFLQQMEGGVGGVGGGGGGGGRGGGGVGGGGGGAGEGVEVAGDGGEGEEGTLKDGEVADKLTPGGAQKGGANMPGGVGGGDDTGGSGAEAKVEGVRVEPAQDESLPAVPCSSPLLGE